MPKRALTSCDVIWQSHLKKVDLILCQSSGNKFKGRRKDIYVLAMCEMSELLWVILITLENETQSSFRVSFDHLWLSTLAMVLQ